MPTLRSSAFAAVLLATVAGATAYPVTRTAAHDLASCGALRFGTSTLEVRRVDPLLSHPSVRAATPPVVGVALEAHVSSQYDISPSWLERELRDRAAGMQSSGSMADCPFAVDGVQIHVRRTSSGLRVELRAPDERGGRELLRRAEATYPGA